MKTPNNNNSQIQQRAARPARWSACVCGLITLFAANVQAQVPVFSNVWNVLAGTIPGIPNNSGNNCRGIAINPVNTNALFFSSTGGTNNGVNHVSTLSFGGTYLWDLNGTGVAGGTLNTEGVRVADDGTVYGTDLSGSPASSFKIFKWPSDSDTVTAQTIVANTAGASFQWRAGDYMDLRGSGSNTEMVVVGNGSGANITTNFIIYRPTDDTCTTFTNFTITIPGSVAGLVNLCGAGVAFEGTNNVIWIRRAGSQETRRISYNPATLTATCDRTNNVDQSVCQGLKYYKANGVQMLATVQASSGNGVSQIARVFQIPTSPTAALISVLSSNLPAVAGSVNGNGLGNVDARNGYFVFGAPGHGLSLFKLGFITNSPPNLTGPSGGGTLIEGLVTNTLSVVVSGSTPLTYQWYFTTNNIPVGANTNFLTFSPIQLTNAGSYFVMVTNPFGAATSGVVTLTVLPKKFSNLATQLWTLAPGSRDYIANDNSQRGAAYDPIFQRVVLVSRTPTNGVHLIDAQTGADQGDLDVAAIATAPPGIFAINACGVADDGAVYVGNLIISGSSDTFAIYQYAGGATNTATMVPVYFGNPLAGTGSAGRIGDTMAVRGAGTNTEILCSFRNGTNVAIFTTTDGSIFNFNLIAVSNFPAILETDSSPAGLGVAWGTGNTFWVKSSGFNLRQVQYDLASQVGGVIHSYNNSIGTEQAIGVDNANGYVATIGATENPQTLPIYDLFANDGNSVAALLDREVFPANNVNGNATGAVAFDIAGGRLFALDSNNGLLALTYAPRLYITPAVQGGVVTWAGPGTLQAAALVTGPYVDVVTTSPYTNTAASQNYFRVRR